MERHVIGSASSDNEGKIGFVSNNAEKKPTNANAQPSVESEKSDAYAHMFAEWDLVPPQVAIRRVRRK